MLKIRTARIEDVELIKAILFDALKEYQIAIPENYPITDIDSIGKKITDSLAFVLVKDDKVAGFIILKSMSEDCMELKRLYLIYSERGGGLGSMLLEYAIQYARNNKNQTIRLETTSKFKEAVTLYKRKGFKLLREVEKSPGHDLAFEKRLR